MGLRLLPTQDSLALTGSEFTSIVAANAPDLRWFALGSPENVGHAYRIVDDVVVPFLVFTSLMVASHFNEPSRVLRRSLSLTSDRSTATYFLTSPGLTPATSARYFIVTGCPCLMAP